MICIAILNWNGYQDTIECLDSLNKMDFTDYFIVIGDNGSTNESMVEIEKFCNSQDVEIEVIDYANPCDSHMINRGQVILLNLKENHGFARGNNLIIEFSERYNPDYYFLLNNDTTIELSCLSQLHSFVENSKSYKAVIPRINYYYDNKKIWNCGGRLFWGFRKYFFAGEYEDVIKKEVVDVSFVTGCALLVSSELIHNHKLLTEKFFFGEEDFEFSTRMKKHKIKMACITSAVVFHKVSASKTNISNLNESHIYYLNRFINMKNYMGRMEYKLWKSIYNPYIFLLLIKKGFAVNVICKFLKTINMESLYLKEVSKNKFLEIINAREVTKK